MVHFVVTCEKSKFQAKKEIAICSMELIHACECKFAGCLLVDSFLAILVEALTNVE